MAHIIDTNKTTDNFAENLRWSCKRFLDGDCVAGQCNYSSIGWCGDYDGIDW